MPDPVLFATIEAGSVSQEKLLVSALRDIAREDPSLRVEFNDETAVGDGFHENRDQIVIAGMGELHFDIVMDRLRKEYKVDADMGSLSVAYKETIVGKSSIPCHPFNTYYYLFHLALPYSDIFHLLFQELARDKRLLLRDGCLTSSCESSLTCPWGH